MAPSGRAQGLLVLIVILAAAHLVSTGKLPNAWRALWGGTPSTRLATPQAAGTPPASQGVGRSAPARTGGGGRSLPQVWEEEMRGTGYARLSR